MGINATTRLRVEVVVDSDEPEMLAAAGLGETTVEWGVRPEWGALPPGGDRGVVPRDEETARRLRDKNPAFWTLVQRDVIRSEWREEPL